ncbi:hypothetical protein IHE44_0013668 [Lamprotornis superbus]|uniref:Uncharacterized protein n=1 Tax=Lamprotornis superbus TaxID=245042 RepID=A0A835NZE3_9PASS|nr:hypothetical protein IHE44_0013668 [Lamprotornis superbus]
MQNTAMELTAEHRSTGVATPAGEDPQHYPLANTNKVVYLIDALMTKAAHSLPGPAAGPLLRVTKTQAGKLQPDLRLYQQQPDHQNNSTASQKCLPAPVRLQPEKGTARGSRSDTHGAASPSRRLYLGLHRIYHPDREPR